MALHLLTVLFLLLPEAVAPASVATPSRDLPDIADEGVLRVAIAPEPTAWSLEFGEPRGFEMDLLRHFVTAQGLRLEVVGIRADADPCLWLSHGRVDIVALRTLPNRCGAVIDVPLAPFAPGLAPFAVNGQAQALAERFQGWVASEDKLRRFLASRFLAGTRTHRSARVLSTYDTLFQDGASLLDWDWRLLAAQAFQESRFDPTAVSSSGALGLMQLLPTTATMLGVSDPTEPAENVAGAVRYLAELEARWQGRVHEADLRSFVLASYNAGPGHVEDAVRLAAAHGSDPQRWRDVRGWLLRKSEPFWAAHPVVKHGPSDGQQAVHYVDAILERYAHYRQLLEDRTVLAS